MRLSSSAWQIFTFTALWAVVEVMMTEKSYVLSAVMATPVSTSICACQRSVVAVGRDSVYVPSMYVYDGLAICAQPGA